MTENIEVFTQSSIRIKDGDDFAGYVKAPVRVERKLSF